MCWSAFAAAKTTWKSQGITSSLFISWMSWYDYASLASCACLGSAGRGSRLLVGFKSSLNTISFWNKDLQSESCFSYAERKERGIVEWELTNCYLHLKFQGHSKSKVNKQINRLCPQWGIAKMEKKELTKLGNRTGIQTEYSLNLNTVVFTTILF